MTETTSAEAEAPIEDIGDSLPPEKNTDTAEETEDENDKLEDFPAEVAGWPDPGFEDVAFPTATG